MTKRTEFQNPVLPEGNLIVGLDVGDRTTHFCVLDDTRAVVGRGRFPTRREELLAQLAKYPGSHVVLEAGSQSAWMSAALRAAAFRVQVADSRRARLISQDPRKNDRRDAEVLARLAYGMPDVLGSVYHRAAATQADLCVLRARDNLVQMRTRLVLQVRGMCKLFGHRLPATSAASFGRRLAEEIPEALKPAVLPLMATLAGLEKTINGYEKQLTAMAKTRYPAARMLGEIPSVGLITSVAYVLTMEDPSRFKDSRKVGSWLGLCPRVDQSGDHAPQLPITKAGNAFLRRLLVQCAHHLLGPFGKDSDLRAFGLRLASRGGASAKKRAAVAVARKLAVLLHRLWVTGEVYQPFRRPSRTPAEAAA